MILKATHLPFVGAIWAYEEVFSSQRPKSGMLSMSGPETPRTRKGFFRSSIQPARSLAAGFRASTSDGHAPSRRPVSDRTQVEPTDSDPQLRALVFKLTTQVEELSSMVSQLQEQREASMAS